MGYDTTYKLSWEPRGDASLPRCGHKNSPKAKYCSECGNSTNPISIDESVRIFLCLEQQRDANFCYGINHEGETTESCKWYNYDKDMAVVSKRFPSVLFILSGEGEESGDIWKSYYLNGKVQKVKAKLQFDPLDLDKMVSIPDK